MVNYPLVVRNTPNTPSLGVRILRRAIVLIRIKSFGLNPVRGVIIPNIILRIIQINLGIRYLIERTLNLCALKNPRILNGVSKPKRLVCNHQTYTRAIVFHFKTCNVPTFRKVTDGYLSTIQSRVLVIRSILFLIGTIVAFSNIKATVRLPIYKHLKAIRFLNVIRISTL